VTNRCVPHPATPADLPTTDAMFAYLHKSTYGEGNTLPDLGNEVVTPADGHPAPGGQGRALRGRREGAQLVARTDAKDATGRAVLGITWHRTTEHGIGNQDEFLFDPVRQRP
jgi:hypothetical protein